MPPSAEGRPLKLDITETGYLQIFSKISSDKIFAGFTKPEIYGDTMPGDAIRALSSLGIAPEIAYMDQVHGGEARVIDSPGLFVCDAIFTSRPGLALVVKTADCLPLIFVNENLGMIGVVHMGWRSARAGIIANIPFKLSGYKVIAGAALRSCCYKVGEEFCGFEGMKEFLTRRRGDIFFDPVGFSKAELLKKGLEGMDFYDAGICSFCSPGGLYSHRKDATPRRMLSFAMLMG